MPIDTEPKDLGPVIQLVAKSDGWTLQETQYRLKPEYIGGDPSPYLVNATPQNLIELLRDAWLTTRDKRPNDHNGLKVAVRRLAVIDGILQTDGVVTDYFTAWGLPKADASKDLFAEHERQVAINRDKAPNAIYETNIPWAVCTHNVLLDPNGRILMMVRSQSQGFQAGRVSVTEEEQMEPTLDISPFAAAYRSYHEELRLVVAPQSMRVLGVALEKGAAYPAYCVVAETDALAQDIVDSWRRARDFNENTALFAVEMSEVDRWLASGEITSDIWHKSLLSGDIAVDAKLKFHATSPWRINLVRRYSMVSSTMTDQAVLDHWDMMQRAGDLR